MKDFTDIYFTELMKINRINIIQIILYKEKYSKPDDDRTFRNKLQKYSATK